jgi:DNA-binding response OmpR family regulator
MRILLVEDDVRIQQSLADDLRRQHHAVDVVGDGPSGFDFARTGVHDIILLDVLLPGLDGLELCRRLRAEKSTALIMMITARDAIDDKVGALDTGADDYLVKPFELSELSARIRALARRPRNGLEPLILHGDLELDPSHVLISCRGVPIPLTGTEYVILETLMRNPRQVFSRGMLCEKIASFDRGSEHDAIKTHITNIRRKVRAAGSSGDPVKNVYGAGYRLGEVRA